VSADDAREHIDNCKHQIETFAGTMAGDQYVFVVFDWKVGNALIEKYVVQRL
jgi:hypothetical protein